MDVYDAQGNLLHKISRPWPLNKLTSKEKEEAKNNYALGFSGRDAPEISYVIADYPQTIKGLDWHDDQLWVEFSESKKQNDVYVVDVFDKEGHLLEKRMNYSRMGFLKSSCTKFSK